MSGAVTCAADLVVGEFQRRVLDGVHDDGLGVGGLGVREEGAWVSGDVDQRRAFPDQKGPVEFVDTRKGAKHSSLIKIRENFIPEMIKSAEDI